MLSFAWHVMAEYKTLLMKMALEGLYNDKAKAKFENFIRACCHFIALVSTSQLDYVQPIV
jgi:hypothetical protein